MQHMDHFSLAVALAGKACVKLLLAECGCKINADRCKRSPCFHMAREAAVRRKELVDRNMVAWMHKRVEKAEEVS